MLGTATLIMSQSSSSCGPKSYDVPCLGLPKVGEIDISSTPKPLHIVSVLEWPTFPPAFLRRTKSRGPKETLR